MKRILIVFVLLLIIPCFAGNNLQLQGENEARQQNTKTIENINNYPQIFFFLLLHDDYLTYKYEKNPDCLYAKALMLKKDCKNELDLKYYNELIKLWETIATFNLDPEKINTQKQSKIIIPNEDYKKLNPKIRQSVIYLNSIISLY